MLTSKLAAKEDGPGQCTVMGLQEQAESLREQLLRSLNINLSNTVTPVQNTTSKQTNTVVVDIVEKKPNECVTDMKLLKTVNSDQPVETKDIVIEDSEKEEGELEEGELGVSNPEPQVDHISKHNTEKPPLPPPSSKPAYRRPLRPATSEKERPAPSLSSRHRNSGSSVVSEFDDLLHQVAGPDRDRRTRASSRDRASFDYSNKNQLDDRGKERERSRLDKDRQSKVTLRPASPDPVWRDSNPSRGPMKSGIYPQHSAPINISPEPSDYSPLLSHSSPGPPFLGEPIPLHHLPPGHGNAMHNMDPSFNNPMRHPHHGMQQPSPMNHGIDPMVYGSNFGDRPPMLPAPAPLHHYGNSRPPLLQYPPSNYGDNYRSLNYPPDFIEGRPPPPPLPRRRSFGVPPPPSPAYPVLPQTGSQRVSESDWKDMTQHTFFGSKVVFNKEVSAIVVLPDEPLPELQGKIPPIIGETGTTLIEVKPTWVPRHIIMNAHESTALTNDNTESVDMDIETLDSETDIDVNPVQSVARTRFHPKQTSDGSNISTNNQAPSQSIPPSLHVGNKSSTTVSAYTPAKPASTTGLTSSLQQQQQLQQLQQQLHQQMSRPPMSALSGGPRRSPATVRASTALRPGGPVRKALPYLQARHLRAQRHPGSPLPGSPYGGHVARDVFQTAGTVTIGNMIIEVGGESSEDQSDDSDDSEEEEDEISSVPGSGALSSYLEFIKKSLTQLHKPQSTSNYGTTEASTESESDQLDLRKKRPTTPPKEQDGPIKRLKSTVSMYVSEMEEKQAKISLLNSQKKTSETKLDNIKKLLQADQERMAIKEGEVKETMEAEALAQAEIDVLRSQLKEKELNLIRLAKKHSEKLQDVIEVKTVVIGNEQKVSEEKAQLALQIAELSKETAELIDLEGKHVQAIEALKKAEAEQSLVEARLAKKRFAAENLVNETTCSSTAPSDDEAALRELLVRQQSMARAKRSKSVGPSLLASSSSNTQSVAKPTSSIKPMTKVPGNQATVVTKATVVKKPMKPMTTSIPVPPGPPSDYESALLMFRGYRVSKMFRTMKSKLGLTAPEYSHKIDPNVPLCPYELDGQCNNDTCRFQHSRDYEVTGLDACKALLLYHPDLANISETNLDQEWDKWLAKYGNSLRDQPAEDVAMLVAADIEKALSKVSTSNGDESKKTAVIPLEGIKSFRALNGPLKTNLSPVTSGGCGTKKPETRDVELWIKKNKDIFEQRIWDAKPRAPFKRYWAHMKEQEQASQPNLVISTLPDTTSTDVGEGGIAIGSVVEEAPVALPADPDELLLKIKNMYSENKNRAEVDTEVYNLVAVAIKSKPFRGNDELWALMAELTGRANGDEDMWNVLKKATQLLPSSFRLWTRYILSNGVYSNRKTIIGDALKVLSQCSYQPRGPTREGSAGLMAVVVRGVVDAITTGNTPDAVVLLQVALGIATPMPSGLENVVTCFTTRDLSLIWLVYISLQATGKVRWILLRPIGPLYDPIVNPLVDFSEVANPGLPFHILKSACEDGLRSCDDSMNKPGADQQYPVELALVYIGLASAYGPAGEAAILAQRFTTRCPTSPPLWLMRASIAAKTSGWEGEMGVYETARAMRDAIGLLPFTVVALAASKACMNGPDKGSDNQEMYKLKGLAWLLWAVEGFYLPNNEQVQEDRDMLEYGRLLFRRHLGLTVDYAEHLPALLPGHSHSELRSSASFWLCYFRYVEISSGLAEPWEDFETALTSVSDVEGQSQLWKACLNWLSNAALAHPSNAKIISRITSLSYRFIREVSTRECSEATCILALADRGLDASHVYNMVDYSDLIAVFHQVLCCIPCAKHGRVYEDMIDRYKGCPAFWIMAGKFIDETGGLPESASRVLQRGLLTCRDSPSLWSAAAMCETKHGQAPPARWLYSVAVGELPLHGSLWLEYVDLEVKDNSTPAVIEAVKEAARARGVLIDLID